MTRVSTSLPRVFGKFRDFVFFKKLLEWVWSSERFIPVPVFFLQKDTYQIPKFTAKFVKTMSLLDTHQLVINGDIKGLKQKLIENPELILERNAKDNNLLMLASRFGHFDIVKYLIEQNRININERNDERYTPLIYSCVEGHSEISELLIKNGANINVKGRHGNTPLIFSCMGKHKECVRVLLNHKVDVQDRNTAGYTALMIAGAEGDTEIFNLLMENGARTTDKDINGTSILMKCSQTGNFSIAKLLIDKGADITEIDKKDGNSILHYASESGNMPLVEFIISKNPKLINAQNLIGETCLMTAIRSAHMNIAHYIAKHDECNVAIKNNAFNSALMICTYKKKAVEGTEVEPLFSDLCDLLCERQIVISTQAKANKFKV